MPDVTVRWITPAARAWLLGAGTARVLNVFDHACNLADEAGQVLSLVTSARGLTPFGLVLETNNAALFGGVTDESPVVRAPGVLSVGPLCLDYARAREWDPCPDWPALRQSLADDPGRLAELVQVVIELAVPGSLLDLFLVPAGASPLAPGLLGRARAGMADLTVGLLAGQPEQTVAGALRLAGLGSGLTPAGDDFAVGACLAAWAGLYGPEAQGLSPVVARAMAPATTALSAAYLWAASRGECAAVWHELFAALRLPAGRERQSALADAAGRLMSVGHTSGADGLAGFLAPHFLQATTS